MNSSSIRRRLMRGGTHTLTTKTELTNRAVINK
jgi:hypothetical protein